MNGEASNLGAVMAQAGARLKWSALLTGLCWWLAVCLGLWLALFACDNLLSLPAGLRLPLTLGGATFSGIYFFRKVLKSALRRQTPERTAVMLEQRYGIGENLLINAIQFQRQKLRPEEAAFAEQTILACSDFAERVRYGELWDWRKLRVWGSAAGAVVVLWIAFIAAFPRQFSAAATRYALPLADTPPPGHLPLKLTPDGDVTVAEGATLDVAVEVQSTAEHALIKSPLIVWQDKSDFVQPSPGTGENAAMTAEPQSSKAETPGTVTQAKTERFLHTFANVQTPFAFRVFAGDSVTRSVTVKVLPLPKLKNAAFIITPPAYTGQKPRTVPGPPAWLTAVAGSSVAISFAVEPAVKSVGWSENGYSLAFTGGGGRWQAMTVITNAATYEIQASYESAGQPLVLARGDVQLIPDYPPEVDFMTEDRNRVVQLGQTLKLDVNARDDFGVARIEVVARPAEKDDTATLVKRWTYLGPPGNPSPMRETLALTVDPQTFESGASYYLEARASDFRLGSALSHSRPLVLRVKSEQDITLRADDPLGAAFDALKRSVASQEKANRLTANLATYLDEVLARHALTDQARALAGQQNDAHSLGREALTLFSQQPDGKSYATSLEPLVIKDMAGVQDGLRTLDSLGKSDLPGRVAEIGNRQDRILIAMLDLLGRLADARLDKLKPGSDTKDTAQAPAIVQSDKGRELLDAVKDFISAEQRVLERSRTLADKEPEDLTKGEMDILGELAREEQKWAKFFEEKLTDFSKLPLQDFADASLSQEFNMVYQEVQEASDALTQKKIELAVPHEQSGLENAQDLVNNLERWLPDAPDNIKWKMEEPLTPADIAMAELPKELEDIVGELLDKEESMTPDIEDVTSSWMDSIDKGAGWGASDGPISDMSAKGVTGNLLPNQNEVGGRSGEGRTSRSHGQMVSDTAEGKGGRETPTRLTPEPFEQGSVKDSAKNDQGGATGGGKLSGSTGEGLRGPTPPPVNQKLPRLADQQARIRQQAEALALQLRRYHVPSGAVESSAKAMGNLEDAARKNDGLAVRRAFSQAVNSLGEAKQTVRDQVTVRREQDKLPPRLREEMRLGVQDGVPKGYEEMVAEYFRALAEGRMK